MPPSVKEARISRSIEGSNNQKEILFNLGKAISGAPIRIGIKKLPKPPISTGITKKKIIKIAWAEITLL